MKRVNYILLLIGLLLCAGLFFGCADPKAGVDDIPADDRVEEDAKGEKEKKEDKEEKQEETTGEDTADAEVTTDVPEETTAKPADTTAAPVVTTGPVKVDPTANVSKVEKPSDDLIKRIEDDFTAIIMKDDRYGPESYGKDHVKYYYGMFNGCVPIMFDWSESGAIMEIQVAGSTFHYGGSNTIRIWKNGEFFHLEDAYEKGILNEEQIAIIAVIHNKGLYYKITQ